MSDYMTVAHCAKCGKEFLPAPNHAYKKNKLQYCSWSCFSHRNDKVKKKELFYGVDTYSAIKPMLYEIAEDLKKANIAVLKCSVRGEKIETKDYIIRMIPRAKRIEGMECEEVFGWIAYLKNTALYLRKYPEIPIYDGTIVDYILEKEGTVDGQVSNM